MAKAEEDLLSRLNQAPSGVKPTVKLTLAKQIKKGDKERRLRTKKIEQGMNSRF